MTYADHIAMLDERLLQAGYLDAHVPRYEQVGYKVTELRSYRVSGEFPRIREAELRPGVGDVSYSVSVAACSAFAVDLTSVTALLALGR